MTVISKTQRSLGWVGLVTIVVCLLCLSAWSPPPAQSDPNLPTRHPTITLQPSDGDDKLSSDRDDKDDKPVGAHIELQVSAAPPDAWTVVQWRDDQGHWHDVEGWRGELDTVDRKVWWVAQREFRSGPFRWVLYASRGGSPLGSSHAFYLPKAPNQTVSVAVSLDPAYRAQPTPTATPSVSALMPTTGAPPATPWPSIIFLLALVLGGGLLSNYARRGR
jgi:RimJ/RimL family protein N-acetyltransferase